MLYNLHTHTFRCNHANGTEEEFIKAAIDAGYKKFGFADHSPMPFPGGWNSWYRMKLEETKGYFDTLTELKEKYKGQIEILRGVEAEYYPEIFPALKDFLSQFPIDFMIIGQHFVDNEYDTGIYSGEHREESDVLVKYVNQVIEGIETGCYTYIAHPDLVDFGGDNEIYKKEMSRLCRRAKELNIPLEVNILGLSGHRQYPSDKFFEIVSEVGNDVVIGIDAHETALIEQTCHIEDAKRFIEKHGLHLLEDVNIVPPVFKR